jgi:hypothetical protein
MKALHHLETALSSTEINLNSFIKRDITPAAEIPSLTARAACFGVPGVFETNIRLLPEDLSHVSQSVLHMLNLELSHLDHLGNEGKNHYLEYPPSHAVDGRWETSFQSIESRHVTFETRNTY